MSNADELLKFKEMLDAGIITQAEFDAQKNKLLGHVTNTAQQQPSMEPNVQQAQAAPEAAVVNEPKKKQGSKIWSIASIICSLIACSQILFFLIAAFVLAILGLVLNKKKLGSIIALVLAIIVALGYTGETVSSDTTAETVKTTESTGAASTQSVAADADEQKKIDSFRDAVEPMLKSSYGDNYMLGVDSTGAYIFLWTDGVEELATKAASGDADAVDQWKAFRITLDAAVASIYQQFEDCDFSDPNADLSVAFFTDSSLENTLITYVSGKCVTDTVLGN